MAEYNKDRKFYWLQIKEDFFEEDSIEWLEEQENGITYSNFYLKLCLKSLRDNGILVRKVGEMLIPYDAKKLSEITRTSKDTVIVAMELLKQIGLVKILDSGEIYMTQIENMIGSKSIGAFKKQQQRQLKKEKECIKELEKTSGGHLSEKCPPEIEIEIELDIDNRSRSIDTTTSTTVEKNIDIFKHLEKCGFQFTSRLIEFVNADIDIYSKEWIIEASDIALERGKINNYGYVRGILQDWLSKGKDVKSNGVISNNTGNKQSSNKPKYNFSDI